MHSAARDRGGLDPSPAQIDTQSDCSFWSAHFALRLLDGPVLDVDDRTFRAGDRVVCLKNRARLGVLNRDLAAIDAHRRAVALRLDRAGQPVTVTQWYLDVGHPDWGYAVTGHKAEGATARRAHTVACDGIDREWIYVMMSRGREVARERFIEYLTLEREIRDRHRDRLAALAYQPSEWFTHSLCEQPADHNRRVAWDAVVDRVLRYRTDLGIPDEAHDFLGPPPASSDVIQRAAWIAARRAVQSDLRLLTMAKGHSSSAIGR